MTRTLLVLIAVLFSTQAFADRCALLENGAIKLFRDYDVCPPNPAGKPQFTWLPAPRVTPPTYDPQAQVLSGPSYSIGQTQVTESWSVRSKTAAELDADKQANVDSTATAVFLAICNHENRIRTLEAKPQITNAQCKAALKALLP